MLGSVYIATYFCLCVHCHWSVRMADRYRYQWP